MPPTVADSISRLEEAIPLSRAAAWDAVGLQVGDPAAPVESAAVCHEVSAAVVAAALAGETALLVSYHPLLFRPSTHFTAGASPVGRAFALATGGVALYVVHTAFDVAAGGCADALAEAVGLGTFEGFGPADSEGAEEGFIGRVGELTEEATLAAFSDAVGTVLSTGVRVAGDFGRHVRRVAVVPGSWSEFAPAAAAVGVDVLVTGDISHHRANEAVEAGLAIIDAGHAATERPGVARLYSLVSNMFKNTIDLTHIDPNPWGRV